MANPSFSIAQGDLLPELSAVLKDADGVAVNLTGATLRFVMRQQGATTNKVAAAATIVTAASGVVKYTWVSGDTSDAGLFDAEFEATFGGKTLTFPSDRFVSILIKDDLG